MGIHKELIVTQYSVTHGVRSADKSTDFDNLMASNFTGSSEFQTFIRSRYLESSSVRTYCENGEIDGVGSHTWDHSSLARDNETLQMEKILTNHQRMGLEFGNHLHYFSYPFGKLDRLSYISEYIAHANCDYVFQCNGGINQNPASLGSILRIGVPDGDEEMLSQLLRIQWVR